MNLCFQVWRTSEREERAGKILKKKVWEENFLSMNPNKMETMLQNRDRELLPLISMWIMHNHFT
jgi:hypothetical protein